MEGLRDAREAENQIRKQVHILELLQRCIAALSGKPTKSA
jgi:hypothetical protein